MGDEIGLWGVCGRLLAGECNYGPDSFLQSLRIIQGVGRHTDRPDLCPQLGEYGGDQVDLGDWLGRAAVCSARRKVSRDWEYADGPDE
jgi:hypothetical protein